MILYQLVSIMWHLRLVFASENSAPQPQPCSKITLMCILPSLICCINRHSGSLHAISIVVSDLNICARFNQICRSLMKRVFRAEHQWCFSFMILDIDIYTMVDQQLTWLDTTI
ncbi:hypothetical protein EDD86DRAFT_19878 [Gorgonomyces haynaldii]|nr:hypothetical protein EDD86DRAFT_19878 [Gorgonomyces haynaldii]